QACHVIRMSVRKNNEIEVGEIDPFCLDVGREDVGIISGIKQDTLPGDLHESREAPILGHRRVCAECVVKDGDLALRLGRLRHRGSYYIGKTTERSRNKKKLSELHGRFSFGNRRRGSLDLVSAPLRYSLQSGVCS